jgi:hypothetical protein
MFPNIKSSLFLDPLRKYKINSFSLGNHLWEFEAADRNANSHLETFQIRAVRTAVLPCFTHLSLQRSSSSRSQNHIFTGSRLPD